MQQLYDWLKERTTNYKLIINKEKDRETLEHYTSKWVEATTILNQLEKWMDKQ